MIVALTEIDLIGPYRSVCCWNSIGPAHIIYANTKRG